MWIASLMTSVTSLPRTWPLRSSSRGRESDAGESRERGDPDSRGDRFVEDPTPASVARTGESSWSDYPPRIPGFPGQGELSSYRDTCALGNNVRVMASKKRRVVGGLVWDSGVGETCPGCGEAIAACGCVAEGDVLEPGKAVRLSLDRKNRKGKAATVIEGVPLVATELAKLTKELKKKAGVGGAVKEGRIEIQGDKRDLMQEELESRGYRVKRVGG